MSLSCVPCKSSVCSGEHKEIGPNTDPPVERKASGDQDEKVPGKNDEYMVVYEYEYDLEPDAPEATNEAEAKPVTRDDRLKKSAEAMALLNQETTLFFQRLIQRQGKRPSARFRQKLAAEVLNEADYEAYLKYNSEHGPTISEQAQSSEGSESGNSTSVSESSSVSRDSEGGETTVVENVVQSEEDYEAGETDEVGEQEDSSEYERNESILAPDKPVDRLEDVKTENLTNTEETDISNKESEPPVSDVKEKIRDIKPSKSDNKRRKMDSNKLKNRKKRDSTENDGEYESVYDNAYSDYKNKIEDQNTASNIKPVGSKQPADNMKKVTDMFDDGYTYTYIYGGSYQSSKAPPPRKHKSAGATDPQYFEKSKNKEPDYYSDWYIYTCSNSTQHKEPEEKSTMGKMKTALFSLLLKAKNKFSSGKKKCKTPPLAPSQSTSDAYEPSQTIKSTANLLENDSEYQTMSSQLPPTYAEEVKLQQDTEYEVLQNIAEECIYHSAHSIHKDATQSFEQLKEPYYTVSVKPKKRLSGDKKPTHPTGRKGSSTSKSSSNSLKQNLSKKESSSAKSNLSGSKGAVSIRTTSRSSFAGAPKINILRESVDEVGKKIRKKSVAEETNYKTLKKNLSGVTEEKSVSKNGHLFIAPPVKGQEETSSFHTASARSSEELDAPPLPPSTEEKYKESTPTDSQGLANICSRQFSYNRLQVRGTWDSKYGSLKNIKKPSDTEVEFIYYKESLDTRLLETVRASATVYVTIVNTDITVVKTVASLYERPIAAKLIHLVYLNIPNQEAMQPQALNRLRMTVTMKLGIVIRQVQPMNHAMLICTPNVDIAEGIELEFAFVPMDKLPDELKCEVLVKAREQKRRSTLEFNRCRSNSQSLIERVLIGSGAGLAPSFMERVPIPEDDYSDYGYTIYMHADEPHDQEANSKVQQNDETEQ